MHDPKVLLLDEATSALDSKSESVVQAALEEITRASERATLAIAHRLSTIQRADRILVLDRGRVVECGAYRELVAGNGLFSQMIEAQDAA